METPTNRVVAESVAEVVVEDALGRRIDVRRITALDRLRLFKAIGPELAQNAPYLGMAMLAASVTAIDDVPMPAPVTERQVEAAVLRLQDAGLSAIASAISENLTPKEGDDLPGNSAGTPIS